MPERVGCSQYDREQAWHILDGWFASRRNRPSAIFTADEQLLLHLYDYLEARGMSIPEDVSVLARGNVGSGDRLRPRPTSLVIPTFRMGELATEMLIDAIEKPGSKPQRVLLPFELVPGSTA